MARVDRLTEPADLVDFNLLKKGHLRVTHDAEDFYIEQIIRTATQAAESYTMRAFMPRRLALVLDCFPCGMIEIPHPPLISLDCIVYLDANGVQRTLAASAYTASIPRGPKATRARIMPAVGTSWPSTYPTLDAVTVTFDAGYVDGGSPAQPNVPEAIVQGVMLTTAALFAHRGDDPRNSLPRHLLDSYRAY